MTQASDSVERDRQLLADAESRGGTARLGAYMRLSGPGWLQSAITLGGGSLGASLYLGVLGGYDLLWVQPLAMILGIIMLSAIGYVTLSTGKQPFRAINEHINPVLGWGWALAVAVANVVWCMPQYSLANGVLSQNLLPGVLGNDGWVTRQATEAFGTDSWFAAYTDELLVSVTILILATIVTWSYDRGGWGLRLYERILKIVVALIVICFLSVVIVLSFGDNPLDWSAVLKGFIPDFSKIANPADGFLPVLDQIGPVGDAARDYWSQLIVDQQRDVLISAAATAVGINMTFLFAYSLLRKGWTKEFRGLIKFDLATGMLIPFLLATSCVVIASASQFHAKPAAGFEFVDGQIVVPDNFAKPFKGMMDARNTAEDIEGNPSMAEQQLAAMLVKRDAFQLAASLEPVTNRFFADYVFGFGVLAMTLSTVSILMLISGFVFTELLGLPSGGWAHRMGTLVAGVGGAFGPFVWSKAAFYLVVPTSVFGFTLLPLAYLTFFLLMNQKSLLGADMPSGWRRFMWNLLMFISASVATVGSIYMVHIKAGGKGIAAIAVFSLVAVLVHFNRKNSAKDNQRDSARSGS